MGSRAVVLVCRDDDVARSASASRAAARCTRGPGGRSSTAEQNARCWRTCGRRPAGLLDELGTDWLLLDAELLPWSAKAGGLIADQYAAVGAAAQAALPAAVSALATAAARGIDVADLLRRTATRSSTVDAYRAAYRRYCWPTTGLDGVRLAPFQLLASEGTAYHDRPHSWHLSLLPTGSPARGFQRTRTLTVDLLDAASVAAGVAGGRS